MDKMTPDAIALNRPTSRLATPAQKPAAQSAEQQRRVILKRAVQLDVIPHLLKRSQLRAPSPSEPSLDAHIPHLTTLSLQGGSRETIEFVVGLFENGISAESLYLDLLAPAAALLGRYWEDDICTFSDVTVGVGHLQAAMRAIAPAFLGAAMPAPAAPRALFLPLPGDQHTFGLAMLSAFFIRAGWDVWSGIVERSTELRARVRADWVDLVGFSIYCDAHLEAARHEIAAVRAASRNQALVVMVGGLPFANDPGLALAIGASGTAQDGKQAVALATALLPPRMAGR